MTKRTLGLLLIGAGIIALFSNIGNGFFGRDRYEYDHEWNSEVAYAVSQGGEDFHENMADFEAEMSDLQAEMRGVQSEINEAVGSNWRESGAEFREEMANLREEMRDVQAEMRDSMPAAPWAEPQPHFQYEYHHRDGSPFGFLLFPLLIGGGIFLLVRRRRMVVRRHQEIHHF
ncbi:MAG: hypothetical protein LCH85_07560 [Chloroflexi bacterium]|nr:hypothetical protein [Chloroflexota bacterium]